MGQRSEVQVGVGKLEAELQKLKQGRICSQHCPKTMPIRLIPALAPTLHFSSPPLPQSLFQGFKRALPLSPFFI